MFDQDSLSSLDVVLVVYVINPGTEGLLSTHVHGNLQSHSELMEFMAQYVPLTHPGVTSWEVLHVAR
jgi:hypothetical protein